MSRMRSTRTRRRCETPVEPGALAALCHAALGFAARDEREGEGENGGVGGGLTGVRRRAVLVEHEVGEREVVVDLAVVRRVKAKVHRRAESERDHGRAWRRAAVKGGAGGV